MKVLQSPLPDDKNPFEFYNHFGRFAALVENENKSWYVRITIICHCNCFLPKKVAKVESIHQIHFPCVCRKASPGYLHDVLGCYRVSGHPAVD